MADLATYIERDQSGLLAEWVKEQLSADTLRKDLLKEAELREQSREFLSLFSTAVASSDQPLSPPWAPVRDFLQNLATARTQRGFNPTEIATFIFSLKQPLFTRVMANIGNDTKKFGQIVWSLTVLLDKLGLMTAEYFQSAREEIIARQQQEMLELSTPVVKLWDGILALPMIGTLDSGRTQVVMESLLQRIVETGAEMAILDITGVPTVDTLVAQHLIKTVTAARLMGADCIISGIRPQIAQTIVHLGVDLQNVITKATLADAFALALRRRGQRVMREATKSAVKAE